MSAVAGCLVCFAVDTSWFELTIRKVGVAIRHSVIFKSTQSKRTHAVPHKKQFISQFCYGPFTPSIGTGMFHEHVALPR